LKTSLLEKIQELKFLGLLEISKFFLLVTMAAQKVSNTVIKAGVHVVPLDI